MKATDVAVTPPATKTRHFSAVQKYDVQKSEVLALAHSTSFEKLMAWNARQKTVLRGTAQFEASVVQRIRKTEFHVTTRRPRSHFSTAAEASEVDLRSLFVCLDVNGDGRVTSKEWLSAIGKHAKLARHCFGGATLSEIGMAFARTTAAGTSDTGEWTWDEFKAIAADHRRNVAEMAESEVELRSLFVSLDSDGDGHVTRKEWGSAISKHAEVASRCFGGATLSEIGAAFSRIDADGSGDLTWSEFMEAAASYRESQVRLARSEAALRKLFTSLDADGDGHVTRKEWGSAIGKHAKLARHCFGGATLSEIGMAFARIDADDSGDLTWDEFKGVAADHRQNAATQMLAAADAHLERVEAVMQAADEGREYR